ncbi:MAG: hypothetical protein R3C28_05695 [Pirellulaceae bacterium]
MHQIRLAGPWTATPLLNEFEPHAASLGAGATEPFSFSTPISIAELFQPFPAAGRLLLARNFNRPTGLDESSELGFLVPIGVEAVELNGSELSLIPTQDQKSLRASISTLQVGLNQVRLQINRNAWDHLPSFDGVSLAIA